MAQVPNESVLSIVRRYWGFDRLRPLQAEAIRAGYYSIQVGRHLVFYTFTDTIVSVRRVLHDQMDVGRHL